MDAEKEFQDFTKPKAELNEDFLVQDLSTANWCLKKIGRAEKRLKDAAEFVEAEKEKLDAYLESVKKEENGTINFFTNKLRPFTAEAIKGGKTKTLKLPDGSCSFKTSGPKIQKDDKVLLAFVKENAPDYIKRSTTESVNWAEYKKNITVTETGACVDKNGEIVPGLFGEESVEVFTVKFGKNKESDESDESEEL